ncbi:hypothetical protein [Pseudomonas aeruginosa]|uniref:hypothetical protein n=2 Tax=Pseudomonas aeruginosa TaxID=287 RepID=UPI0035266172
MAYQMDTPPVNALPDDSGAKQLLGFWHALEMVQARFIPEVNLRAVGQAKRVVEIGLTHPEQAPWEQAADGQGETYRVYLGCFGSRSAYDLLTPGSVREASVSDSVHGSYALCMIEVDAGTGYRKGTFSLSTASWAIGRLIHGHSIQNGYEAAQAYLSEAADDMLSVPSGQLRERMRDLCDQVRLHLGLVELAKENEHRARCVLKAPASAAGREAHPLNSPHVADIERVQKHLGAGGTSPVLDGYLNREPTLIRLDVESEEGQELSALALMPHSGQLAAWPTRDRASKSEILSSNLIRRELTSAGGIQAVSQPEGSESHRVVRKILLDSMVAKADVLASLPRPQLAFTNRSAGAGCRRQGEAWQLCEGLLDHGVVLISGLQASIPGLLASLRPELQVSDGDRLIAELQQSVVTPYDLSASQSVDRFAAQAPVQESVLLGLLRASASDQVASEGRNALWHEAVRRYRAARENVLSLLGDTRGLSAGAKRYMQLSARLSAVERALDLSEAGLQEHRESLSDIDGKVMQQLQHELQEVIRQQSFANSVRGRVLNALQGLWRSSAGESRRQGLAERAESLASEIRTSQRRVDTALRDIEREREEVSRLEAGVAELEADLQALLASVLPDCYAIGAHHLAEWFTGKSLHALETELTELWLIDGLRDAQEQLLHEATRLLAVFMRLESRRLQKNLEQGLRILSGQTPQRDGGHQVESLVATVLLFTPVAVLTPSDVEARLQSLPASTLGWVILTDAGCIPAPAALGAVFRGRRVVSIGDSTARRVGPQLPEGVIRQLAEQSGLGDDWRQYMASAQDMAERASVYGTVRVTDLESRWTGLPIRAVPYGAEPMLSILARLSRGRRVAVRRPGGIAGAFGSGWIDIRGEGSGNWIGAEGRALERLLDSLAERGIPNQQISVVSPFRRAVVELRKLLAGTGYPLGLIESLRGRPTDIVIIVLGGSRPGARDWVCEDPSQMVVATAAARSGLYLIGDRADWSRRPVMKPFAELLVPLNVDVTVHYSPAGQSGTSIARQRAHRNEQSMGQVIAHARPAPAKAAGAAGSGHAQE